ncbi:hypothetical protein ES288_D05G393500v1 [Gossypium darwinii]|uniref:Copia protein n=1 Tax=Gossypium darwinii TaxID=34276 RepID=A0A5D2CRS1_GOSDA|nr:hypothetical protein ES288_D05G393500v1 [Gossypium darwinii]
MVVNPTHHARMKHVEIDHHFVREKVLDAAYPFFFSHFRFQSSFLFFVPLSQDMCSFYIYARIPYVLLAQIP